MELGPRPRRVTSFDSRNSLASLGGQGLEAWQDAAMNDTFSQKEILGNGLSASNICRQATFWKFKDPVQQDTADIEASKSCELKDVFEAFDVRGASAWKQPVSLMNVNHAVQVPSTVVGGRTCYACDSEKKAHIKEMAVEVPSPQRRGKNLKIVSSQHEPDETLLSKADKGLDCAPLAACGKMGERMLETAPLVGDSAVMDNICQPENEKAGWRSGGEALAQPDCITNKPFYSRVEDIPVVLSRCDQKLRYKVVYNWDENYDWMPQSEWIGKTDEDLMPGIEGASALYEHKFTCYRTGSVQKREICLMDVPNYGTQVWLVMTWADVRSDRDVMGVYAACVEVTDIALQREYLGMLRQDSPERLCAIQKLERMVDMTAVALETRAACLASATFKIRSPLAGIFGAADALAAMPLTREQRGLLRLVRTSGEALLELARGALAQEVVLGGHIEVMNKVFRPSVVVERALQDTRATAEWPGVSFTSDTDVQVPRKVIADSLLLLQSLQILLRHVACDMQSGTVCVRLQLVAPNSSPREETADSSDSGNHDNTRPPIAQASAPPLNGRKEEMEGCHSKRQKVEALAEGSSAGGGGGGGGVAWVRSFAKGSSVLPAEGVANTCENNRFLSADQAGTVYGGGGGGGQQNELAVARALVDCQLSLAPPGSNHVQRLDLQEHNTVVAGARKRGSSVGMERESERGEVDVRPLWEENVTLLRFEVGEIVPGSSMPDDRQLQSGMGFAMEVPVPRPVGSQLGLCRRLVRLMGGMLHANSIRGQRTSYNFTIPCREAEAAVEQWRAHGSSSLASPPPPPPPAPLCSPRASIVALPPPPPPLSPSSHDHPHPHPHPHHGRQRPPPLPACGSSPNPPPTWSGDHHHHHHRHFSPRLPPNAAAAACRADRDDHDDDAAADEPAGVPGSSDRHSCALFPVPSSSQMQRAGRSTRGMKVLLVEKNLEDAASLTAILQQLDLEIELVSSAAHAFHALTTSSPCDLLLVDEGVAREAQHPGGVELSLESICVTARGAHKERGGGWLPIVAIRDSPFVGGGGGAAQSKQPSLVEGVDAFIAKPATLFKVQVVTHELLGKG